MRRRRRAGTPAHPTTAWRGQGLAMLIGHARSGTTVLARALGSHPEVGYWEEPALLSRLDRRLGWLDKVAPHLVADAAVSDLSRTDRDGNLRKQFGDEIAVDERDVEQVRVNVIRSIVDSLRRDFLGRSGGSILLEKTPRDIVLADRIPRWFPEARTIHIVRDGRDVVCSGLTWEERWGRPPWVPDEGDLLEVIARQWADQVGKALRAATDRTLLVRYEDLTADGEDTVAACVEHLGLSWHRDIDRFLAKGMGGLHRGSVGRWREELSPEQQDRVHELAGATLTAAGYALER